MQFYKVWQEPSLIRFGLTHPTQLSIVWLSCLIIKPYTYVLDVFWVQSLHFCWHYFLSSFSPISLHGTTFILSPRAKLSALHTCAQGRGCCIDLFRPSPSPPLSPEFAYYPPSSRIQNGYPPSQTLACTSMVSYLYQRWCFYSPRSHTSYIEGPKNMLHFQFPFFDLSSSFYSIWASS